MGNWKPSKYDTFEAALRRFLKQHKKRRKRK
jgi:hypothetical protein